MNLIHLFTSHDLSNFLEIEDSFKYYVSHTYVASFNTTTGLAEQTYSWGNNYGEDKEGFFLWDNGNWNSNTLQDLSVAEEAYKQGLIYINRRWKNWTVY